MPPIKKAMPTRRTSTSMPGSKVNSPAAICDMPNKNARMPTNLRMRPTTRITRRRMARRLWMPSSSVSAGFYGPAMKTHQQARQAHHEAYRQWLDEHDVDVLEELRRRREAGRERLRSR